MRKNDTRIQWVLVDPTGDEPVYFKFRVSPMGFIRKFRETPYLSDATIVSNSIHALIQDRVVKRAKMKRYKNVVWNMVTIGREE